MRTIAIPCIIEELFDSYDSIHCRFRPNDNFIERKPTGNWDTQVEENVRFCRPISFVVPDMLRLKSSIIWIKCNPHFALTCVFRRFDEVDTCNYNRENLTQYASIKSCKFFTLWRTGIGVSFHVKDS